MPSQTILITGALGFVGAPLREALERLGYRVHVYDKRLGQDVLDRAALACSLRDANAVVHLASPSSTLMFDEDPELQMRESLQGLRNITEQWDGLLIFPSTGTLYGDSIEPIGERQALPPPRNHYAACKRASEEICEDYARRGSRSIVLRVFTGYGPGDAAKGVYASAVAQLAQAMARGEQPVVYGDGTQLRDFVHVDDIVQAMVKALRSSLSFGIFNVGSGKGTPFLDVLRQIGDQVGRCPQPIFKPRPAGYVHCTIADLTSTRGALGYEPHWDFAEGVVNALRDLRDQPVRCVS
jgi:UDP-glucose 4-epimerase